MKNIILAIVLSVLSVNAMANCTTETGVKFDLDVKPWGDISVNGAKYNQNKQIQDYNDPKTLEKVTQYSSENGNGGDFVDAEYHHTGGFWSGYIKTTNSVMMFTCDKEAN